MAIITIPTVPASGASFRLIRGDSTLEFIGGGAAVVQSTKAIWAISFPLRPQKIDLTRPWQAALVQLSKPANQFRITPPGWVSGTGYAGGTPLVNGPDQLGLSLLCDGVALSTTIALAGDYIGVNTVDPELKMLTEDAISNGTGDVTFNFEPALRTSPVNNNPIEILAPLITMRLMTPEAAWSAILSGFYDISIDAIEHF